MSAEPTLVTARHFAYLAARTRPEDPLLQSLRAEATAARIPAIWICPEQASFMQILLKLIGARRVLEVGTLAGYSALAMARALPADGKLLTVEILPRHAEFARAQIARAGLTDRVEVRLGDGRAVLPALGAGVMDAAFLDADKASYGFYLKECLRIVRPGGLIMVDNAFAFGQLFEPDSKDREVPAVREFNDQMAATAGLHGVIVPLGDGLWVAVRE